MVKNKNKNLSYELLTTPLLSETATISKTLNQNHLNLFPKYPVTATYFQSEGETVGQRLLTSSVGGFLLEKISGPKIHLWMAKPVSITILVENHTSSTSWVL